MFEIIHAPKLEALALELMRQLQRLRRHHPSQIFEPIDIVVGHIGIARWLEQRIAQHFGVCANFRFLLISEWLEQQMRRYVPVAATDLAEEREFGVDSPARYQQGTMTWGIYGLLAQPERFGLPSAAHSNERERFHAAGRLARLFLDYLIYRREWLEDFERESKRPLEVPASIREQQARIWCALQKEFGKTHRAARFEELLRAIARHQSAQAADRFSTEVLPSLAGPEYALFFGVSHLPPDILQLLQALSEGQTVQLYFANPCLEYWADLVRERFLQQRRLVGDLLQASGGEAPGNFDHFDVGHPLLASLGGHGQAFFAELANASEHFSEAKQMENEPPSAYGLLASLQYGIERLKPDFAPARMLFDQSVEVLQTSNLLDELYLVKAKILRALHDDNQLQFEDIAILAPNLAPYVPLLPVVFGDELRSARQASASSAFGRTRSGTVLPYSLLDFQAPSPKPSLLATLKILLGAGQMRWDVPQLKSLLAVPEVMLQFDLSNSDLAHVGDLLERARIAFAFNDAHRRRLIDSASSEDRVLHSMHTWEAGLDRLLFGYLHGNDESETTPEAEAADFVADDAAQIYPVSNMGAGHAKLLTALSQLLRSLRIWMLGTRRERNISEWIHWLERQLSSFVGRAASQAEIAEPTHAIFRQLQTEVELADPTLLLSFEALSEALLQSIAELGRRHTPALGAVCIGGLVPMRALPFQMICLIGLNEGEFPKPELPDSQNLMRAPGARRAGDRHRVQEDRYLLLEAIMSARKKLLLSYQALKVDGSSRAPAGVLSEVLAQLDRQFKARLPTRPWLSECRNVSVLGKRGDSFDADSKAEVAEESLHSNAKSNVALAQTKTLELGSFLAFWRNPLRTVLRQRFQLSVEEIAQIDEPGSEPLSLETERIERIEARLLKHACLSGELKEVPPSWLALSGILPGGALGVRAWEQLLESVRPSWSAIMQRFPTLSHAHVAPIRIDLQLESTRLVGFLPNAFSQAHLFVNFSTKPAHGAQKLQLLMHTLLARAANPEQIWNAIDCFDRPQELPIAGDAATARAYLQSMIEMHDEFLESTSAFGLPESGVDHSTSLPWFWPKLSHLAFAKGASPAMAMAQRERLKQDIQSYLHSGFEFELAGSGASLWLQKGQFFAANSAPFTQFIELAAKVFAPLAASRESAPMHPTIEELGFSDDNFESANSQFGLDETARPSSPWYARYEH